MIQCRPTTKSGTLIFLLTALLLVPELGQCFYNPSTGRWLTRDPIGEAGGFNLYSLVANNPVNENDPVGLCNIKIRCSPVREHGVTVGWHCGVIGPDNTTYELGGVGIGGSSGGTPVIYPNPIYTNTPPQTYKDYPVS